MNHGISCVVAFIICQKPTSSYTKPAIHIGEVGNSNIFIQCNQLVFPLPPHKKEADQKDLLLCK